MEETASVRRWRLAERVLKKAANPKVPPDLAERASRNAEALKAAVVRHEEKKLTKILEKHKRRESRRDER
jgi:hypothetical protein